MVSIVMRVCTHVYTSQKGLRARTHGRNVPDMHQIKLRDGALRDSMKRAGIESRDELARRVGVDRVTAYRLEVEKVLPSPKFIAGLLILTGCAFEDLFEIVKDAA